MKTGFINILFLIGAFIGLTGCVEIVKETKPPMLFDAQLPFTVDFGRGSGWHGLDTVSIKPSGQTTLYRQGGALKNEVYHFYWEAATLSLSKKSVEKIGQIISSLKITKMARRYHGGELDGTQWVFWLRQNGQEKSIYFDNYFPDRIQKFADQLDAELESAGMSKLKWQRVPEGEFGKHDKEIWNSIK